MRLISLVVAAAAFSALAFAPAQATRTIRADESMNELSTIGEAWGNATEFNSLPSDGTYWLASSHLFLNIGSGGQDYTACFSANGFASLFSGSGGCQSDGKSPASDNEISPALLSVTSSDTIFDTYKTGIIEPGFPSDQTQFDASAFTWDFNSTQLIFLLAKDGSGDFNIEFNYDNPTDPLATGGYTFDAGGTDISGSPVVGGKFTSLEDICFRGGVSVACGTNTTSLPEPAAIWLFAAGLMGALAFIRPRKVIGSEG